MAQVIKVTNNLQFSIAYWEEITMFARPQGFPRRLFSLILSLLTVCALLTAAKAQTEVTGAFQGYVLDNRTNSPIPNALVRFINQDNRVPVASRTNAQGQFFKGNLYPGRYVIEVTAQGYTPARQEMTLPTMRSTIVIPEPIRLEPVPVAPTPTPADVPKPTDPQPPVKPEPPVPTPTTTPGPIIDSINITAELHAADARRSGTFTEAEVAALPLGGTSFTRSFDELALLLPGVAMPPQTQGRVAGPGVGPGVGSSGQFAVNGLRSRANNFTVDGSDNNDEDIGVRRQGFFTLVPQSIESIREYQVITTLAPAQYGRNLSAQVNAISKSGGSLTHGTFYGFLNTSDLNARDYFDQAGGVTRLALRAPLADGSTREVRLNGQPLFVNNSGAGRKESLTYASAGFVISGPLLAPSANNSGKSAFYFFSAEGQILNANQEVNFSVPTVSQRGFGQTGATGQGSVQQPFYPTSYQGDAIFSLFPFPNNPSGPYGLNTFTQVLPASAQGNVASLKFDHTFKAWEREHSLTGRYNRTQDWRNIPATGGAIFAVLRPKVETHNFSVFLNSDVTGPNAVNPILNQFRASYGRTRLLFEEERDTEFLIPSSIFPNTPFLLNAPLIENGTLPTNDPNRNYASYFSSRANTELGGATPGQRRPGGALGPVGQVIIPGFSPVGVDVFNFPQQRINNTYQVADTLTLRTVARGQHSLAFGGDFRRSELNSDLPRIARPLITFGSAPVVTARAYNLATDTYTGLAFSNFFYRPDSLAAVSAASRISQTLALRPSNSNIHLRYYQTNFFGQDEWRIRPNFSLSYGLRYEYNTPPSESSGLIENSFNDPALNIQGVSGLKQFIAGRDRIFDPDRNNFAPRVGFAYSPLIFPRKSTVIRAGYGLYYDQMLGAVVSQSRNVFPNFLTLNFGGGIGTRVNFIVNDGGVQRTLPRFGYDIFNPALSLASRGGFSNGIRFVTPRNCQLENGAFCPYVLDGTLNQLNPLLPLESLVSIVNQDFPGGFGLTLPARDLAAPMAHHYSFTIEQQLGTNLVASAAYVGTLGRDLLRLTTPNLGENVILFSLPDGDNLAFFTSDLVPILFGDPVAPGVRRIADTARIVNGLRSEGALVGGRPVANAGAINRYETTATSRYDSLQLTLRGQLRNALQYQLSYTFSKALDDVSDVFDLAGAPALAQDSFNLGAERGLANFDVTHRFAYSFVYSFPTLANSSRAERLLLGGYELAGTGQFNTGQPYTVNSLFDVNLDGNVTDRLNSTNGVITSGDGRRPLRLATDDVPTRAALRAPVGTNGIVGRNIFRAGGLLLLNLALTKNFTFTDRQKMIFRVEAFNFLNRPNFAIPVRFLEAPSFGFATDTATPGRRIQFALKYSF
jgi:hypothetical protein